MEKVKKQSNKATVGAIGVLFIVLGALIFTISIIWLTKSPVKETEENIRLLFIQRMLPYFSTAFYTPGFIMIFIYIFYNKPIRKK